MWEWTGYGQTDCGLVRSSNQDAFLVDNRRRLWAVADGMGGHPGGDVASRIVMDTLADFSSSLTRSSENPDEDHTEQQSFLLTTMADQAHAAVCRYADHHPHLSGMGTTLVMAHLLPLPAPRLLVLNVGDSRAYLVRAGHITQLTRDHTVIDDYVRDGHLTPEQAARHPDRHVLTRAIGLGGALESDLFTFEILTGDLLLLCSDGLTKMLPDERILEIAHAHRDNPPVATHTLIQAAIDAGGIDNVTVVACAVTGMPDQANIH
jgi:protein phosphatase